MIYTVNLEKNITPNHFIISSSINDTVYIDDNPNVSSTRYSKAVYGEGTRDLYATVIGLYNLYLLSETGGHVYIEAYYSEFTENSISKVITTTPLGGNYNAPVPVHYALSADDTQSVKTSAGWVVAFGAGESSYTYLLNNDVAVWYGDYIAAQPMYFDTDIKIYTPVDNDYVSIVFY